MQNCKHEFIIDRVGLYTIFPLVMRLTSRKTAFCVQPTSSKFLMLKSILYATRVSLNMFDLLHLELRMASFNCLSEKFSLIASMSSMAGKLPESLGACLDSVILKYSTNFSL